MTMMAYWGDDAVEVFYTGPGGVWVTGRNLPNEMRRRRANILITGPPSADQEVVEQMLREMRMVRTGEWGTAPDGRGRWAAEVAWMTGVAGE